MSKNKEGEIYVESMVRNRLVWLEEGLCYIEYGRFLILCI